MEKITVMEKLVEQAGCRAVANSSPASRDEPGEVHGRGTSRSSESSCGGAEQADAQPKDKTTRSLRKSETDRGSKWAKQVGGAGDVSK